MEIAWPRVDDVYLWLVGAENKGIGRLAGVSSCAPERPKVHFREGLGWMIESLMELSVYFISSHLISSHLMF